MDAPFVLGILGGGQLGHMIADAAHQKGLRVIIYDRDPEAPAFAVADQTIVASFEDREALRRFAAAADLITLEFENIPYATLAFLETLKPLFPSARIVRTCQDRLLEKDFLQSHGFSVAPYAEVTSEASLKEAVQLIGTPSILKTATLGYDGKGQVTLQADANLSVVWEKLASGLTRIFHTDRHEEAAKADEIRQTKILTPSCVSTHCSSQNQSLTQYSSGFPASAVDRYEISGLSTPRAVLEKKVSFVAECSVIVARSEQGEMVICATQENIHHHGILERSLFPPSFSTEIQSRAEGIGKEIAAALGIVGLLAVEFFVIPDGSLLVNELAPRPHNSGHHTIESLSISQFEQLICAITGLPLIAPKKVTDAVMVNLLGDLWKEGEPDWKEIKANALAHLHLYGKKEARPGRKMGHVTFTEMEETSS